MRVWRSASDHTRIYWTVRPEGGRWSATERVEFPDTSSNGRWNYEDVTVEVEVEAPAATPATAPLSQSTSGTGPTTGTVTLPAGVYVCRTDYRNNVRDGGASAHIATHLHWSDGSDLFINEVEASNTHEHVVRSSGGRFIYEVDSQPGTEWTFACATLDQR